MKEVNASVNLSPFASDERQSVVYSLSVNAHNSITKIRNTISYLRDNHELSGKNVVNSTSELTHVVYRSKVQALTKNPAMFRTFQKRLAQENEKASSKERTGELLHEFLDNYLLQEIVLESAEETTTESKTAIVFMEDLEYKPGERAFPSLDPTVCSYETGSDSEDSGSQE